MNLLIKIQTRRHWPSCSWLGEQEQTCLPEFFFLETHNTERKFSVKFPFLLSAWLSGCCFFKTSNTMAYINKARQGSFFGFKKFCKRALMWKYVFGNIYLAQIFYKNLTISHYMIFKFGSIYLNKHGGVFFDMQCTQRKRIFDSVKVSES